MSSQDKIELLLNKKTVGCRTWCLDPQESLSPGQAAENDRVLRYYPYLNDDDIVREILDCWLSD